MSAIRMIQQSLGAQLLQVQWQASEIPLLYLSPIALGDVPRRGGVPVLFPQFAKRGTLAKHGFARNLSWQCIRHVDDAPADGVLEGGRHSQYQSHYQLKILPAFLPEWPNAATLDLFVACQAHELEMRLRISNTGSQAWSWTGGLHPYWYVDDLLQAQVTGLGHAQYEDAYAKDRPVFTQPDEVLRFDGAPLERLYQHAPALELMQAGRKIKLSCQGFEQWMIWNPGQAGESEFADLPPGDWRHFICIEPVVARQALLLEPGQTFEGVLCAQVW